LGGGGDRQRQEDFVDCGKESETCTRPIRLRYRIRYINVGTLDLSQAGAVTVKV